jgi:hypothetical protein
MACHLLAPNPLAPHLMAPYPLVPHLMQLLYPTADAGLSGERSGGVPPW